jgi:hypothetical protein
VIPFRDRTQAKGPRPYAESCISQILNFVLAVTRKSRTAYFV